MSNLPVLSSEEVAKAINRWSCCLPPNSIVEAIAALLPDDARLQFRNTVQGLSPDRRELPEHLRSFKMVEPTNAQICALTAFCELWVYSRDENSECMKWLKSVFAPDGWPPAYAPYCSTPSQGEEITSAMLRAATGVSIMEGTYGISEQDAAAVYKAMRKAAVTGAKE